MATDFDVLKRLTPRGLYGRAALILFLPVVVISVVVTVVFLQRHFEDVTRQMTAGPILELRLIASRVALAPDEAAAREAAAALTAPLGLGLQLPAPVPQQDSRRAYDLSGRVVMAQFRAGLPNLAAVDLSDTRLARVSFAGPRPFRVDIPRNRLTAANPHQLLVLLMGTSLLMGGIASIFLRNQLRPIRRLAKAAEAYGRGRIVPYRPAGAVEVRSAGAAFLDMRSRIERTNEQRKLMLSGISHDLRTPLTRLRLSLSMLSPDIPPDAAEIRDMERDVAELGALTDAFLDHVRDAAREEPAELVALDAFLNELVADAQRAGQQVTRAGGPLPAGAAATFRPGALRRALTNLLANAARHAQRAEVSVTLGRRSLVITVEDDGAGIPADQREHAMRPFVRLDPSRNRGGDAPLDVNASRQGQGGAGLGLSIAADIVRAHGGQLRLLDGPRLGGLRAEIVLPC